MESNYAATPRKKKIKYTFHPEEKDTPPALWQEKAAKFLLWTQAQLSTPGGAAALDVLTGKGLTLETIRAAGIGANTGESGGIYTETFLHGDCPRNIKKTEN